MIVSPRVSSQHFQFFTTISLHQNSHCLMPPCSQSSIFRADVSHSYPKKRCHPQSTIYESSSLIGSYISIPSTAISKPIVTPVNYDRHRSLMMATQNIDEHDTLLASTLTTKLLFPSLSTT